MTSLVHSRRDASAASAARREARARDIPWRLPRAAEVYDQALAIAAAWAEEEAESREWRAESRSEEPFV